MHRWWVLHCNGTCCVWRGNYISSLRNLNQNHWSFFFIHLIPKWRRPRMVWVELHENEASRATEHMRFYEATTGKWIDILRIQEKKHQNSEYQSLLTWLRKAKAFLLNEYLHEIQTHQDQSYFYYRSRDVLPQFQSPRGTTWLETCALYCL